MRLSGYWFSIVFLLSPHFSFAQYNTLQLTEQNATQEKTKESPLSHLWLNALGVYTDFKFHSIAGNNYNLFKGYSKLASIGGNNVLLPHHWIAGIELLKVDTILGAQTLLNPGLPAKTNQSIRNNTLFGHLLKQLNDHWFADFSAAYGKNRLNIMSFITTPTGELIGSASTSSTNWFASAMGIYSKNWKQWIITANGRLLYSEVNNGSYSFLFQPTAANQIVAPLSNKSWYLMENIELGYQLERLSWTPFINAGLVQVLSFRNSRSLTNIAINGISPQLNVDKDGVRVGGGLAYTNKQFTLRIEEQYYNAGGIYSSYQTFLGIRYALA